MQRLLRRSAGRGGGCQERWLPLQPGQGGGGGGWQLLQRPGDASIGNEFALAGETVALNTGMSLRVEALDATARTATVTVTVPCTEDVGDITRRAAASASYTSGWSSVGDAVDGSLTPMGYDSEFTNKNATIMSWNLMHTAKMLRDSGGFPVGGNVAATWRDQTNAADQDPEAP